MAGASPVERTRAGAWWDIEAIGPSTSPHPHSAHRNLELKAADPDPASTLAAALALGATDEGTLRQRDTYFSVPHGRLKLREQTPGSAHLIHYTRADQPPERESVYRIVAVPDAAGLVATLAAALTIRGVVVKERRLLRWRGVRIHLDRVEGLGAFVELEAVLAGDEIPADAQPRIDELRAVLHVADEHLRSRGYADLLLDDRG